MGNAIKDTLKQMRSQLESMFKFEETPETPGAEATDSNKEYSLADGNKVNISELKEGGIVSTPDANGTQVPVAAGEYTLADGSVLTVGEGGSISAIKAPEAQTTEEETPEQSIQKMREIMQSFADPAVPATDQMSNIIACVKALMNYAFGWEMRRAEEEAGRQAALTAYQTMSSQESTNKLQEEMEKMRKEFAQKFAEQGQTMLQFVEALELLTEIPGEKPATGATSNQSFRAKVKEEKTNTLARRMSAAAE